MSSAPLAPATARSFAGTVKALRRYTQQGAQPERCDFCSSPISASHRHLLEVEPRRVICACDPCALRFQGVVGGRYRLIPRDARALPELRMPDGLWESFAFPINLIFFFQRSADGSVGAFYPSPAGATESLLPLESWRTLVSENPFLAELEPDVEALLVNRVGSVRRYYQAPIDRCFELAGLIRRHWRGLSGGEEVWGRIDEFFARLDRDALPREAGTLAEANHA
ncbi:MAG TPA: DUF5947 family protein [Verrucomicrobiaceae bacterium]